MTQIDRTLLFAEAEKAATRAAYATDWRDFAAWRALRGATALLAHQGIEGDTRARLSLADELSFRRAGLDTPGGAVRSVHCGGRRHAWGGFYLPLGWPR